jgi:hypothetical protein
MPIFGSAVMRFSRKGNSMMNLTARTILKAATTTIRLPWAPSALWTCGLAAIDTAPAAAGGTIHRDDILHQRYRALAHLAFRLAVVAGLFAGALALTRV